MPSFYGENPPDTEVGSTDATESQVSEDAVTETDTSGGFYQGSPEQTTTEAYEEDARQAKEAAETAQTAAEAAQAAAEASESAASSSESNAASSQTAAATSATNASNSASAAAGSATTAATQASNAASSATAAAGSASNAASSESAAASSETAAASSQTAAAGSATAAASSAGTASTKASEAATSATNAAASESAAASSESNASTSASQAATSATNAASSESAAASSETNAASSASAASTSASNAASSASAASSSATAAASSASSASTSATAAGSARDAALAALDSFDDRYLGQKSSDPSLDNDGNALVAGALYFDTVNTVMKVYDGSQWLAAYASVSGALLAINNLNDVSNTATARSNLGLGTASEQNVGYFATAAQGSLADSALQNGDNVSVLTNDSGYLTGNETITLTGDVSGSGTTSISVTIADDSHTHDTRYYTETEIDNYFSGSSAITGYNKTNWDTAYGWGDHGVEGYLTGNQTITLTGDVSGSGTTSIAVTIADDSHNHVISNVDGLQTALDGKVDLAGDTMTGTLNGTSFLASGTIGNLTPGSQGQQMEKGDTSVTTLRFDADRWRLYAGNNAGEIISAYENGNIDFTTGNLLKNGTAWMDNSRNMSNIGTISSGAITSTGTSTFAGIRVNNSNTALSQGGGNSLRIQTSSGYVEVGPRNTGYAHFNTDRAAYYFEDPVHFDGQIYNYVSGGTSDPYWRAGNDGSGSGLDADLLDGVQGSSFLRSDANDSWSGTLTATIAAGSNALDLATNDAYASMRVIRNTKASGSGSDGMYIGYGNANGGLTRIFGGGATSGGIYINGSGANDLKYNNASVLWHAGNDGSGSGLDADLLDGFHLSSIPYATDGNPRGSVNTANSAAGSAANALTRSCFFRDNNVDFAALGINVQHSTSTGYNFQFGVRSYSDASALRVRVKNNGTWGSRLVVWNSGNDGSGSGLDADVIKGRTWSESVTANTLVSRQANGYIYANHINFSTSETENPTINSFFTSNGDGWSRKASIGHVRNQLGNAKSWSSGYGASSGSWYTIAQLSESNTPCIVSLKSSAHSTALIACTVGYSGSNDGHVDVLSSTWTQNGGYPGVSRVRIVRESNNSHLLQVQLYWTTSIAGFTLYAAIAAGPAASGNYPAFSSSLSVYSGSGTVVAEARCDLSRSTFSKVPYVGSDVMWHAGNDGSGSGLDADTLDGVQAGSFLRSDANDTLTANLNQTSGNFVSNGFSTTDLNTAWQVAGTGKSVGIAPFRYQNSASNKPESGDNAHWGLNIWAHGGSSGNYPYGHQLSAASSGNIWQRWVSNGSFGGWRKIFDSGNDGSGSGLDADLLDGVDSSGYMRKNTNQTLSANITFNGDMVGGGDGHRDHGVYGNYNSYRIHHMWGMGAAYRINSNGSDFGNLYGCAYTYHNRVYTSNSMAGHHQMVWCQNGTPTAALGSNVWTSGNVVAYSDIRVKTNLEVIPDALSKVQQLNGYTFDRTDVKYDEEGNPTVPVRQTGVVAQEVLEVLPEAVTGDEESHYNVAYGNMVGLLIEAIKELKAEVDDLKAQLEEYK